jgi:hypothetical protein
LSGVLIKMTIRRAAARQQTLQVSIEAAALHKLYTDAIAAKVRQEAVKVFRAAAECSKRYACGQMEASQALLRYRP